MILTKEQVDRYEKCWNLEQDCEDCSLRAKPGQHSYNGCTATGQRLIDTIRHYMAESAAKDARIAELEKVAKMQYQMLRELEWTAVDPNADGGNDYCPDCGNKQFKGHDIRYCDLARTIKAYVEAAKEASEG